MQEIRSIDSNRREENYLRETIRAQLSVKRLLPVKSFRRKEIKEKKRGLLKPEVNFFLLILYLLVQKFQVDAEIEPFCFTHAAFFFSFSPEVFQSRRRTEPLSYYLERWKAERKWGPSLKECSLWGR